MFAPTTSNTLPASHAGAHDYDPRQEEFSVNTEHDRTSAAVEGVAHKSRGTHTATPESRGSTLTPTRGRSLDQNKQQSTEGAAPLCASDIQPASVHSTESSEMRHRPNKPSFTDKITGRIDVLVGKASHNQGKILEGNMKQRGEDTSQVA